MNNGCMNDRELNLRDSLLYEITQKEVQAGFYNIKADGVSIYNFIKRGVRLWLLHCNGIELKTEPLKIEKSIYRKVVLKSLWHLFLLFICNKKFTNLLYSTRTYKVDGKFMDKFVDPLIDFSGIGDSYIVIENRVGLHNVPRLHAQGVIYGEGIDWIAEKIASFKMRRSNNTISKKYEELKDLIESTFSGTDLSKTNYKKFVIRGYYIVKLYRFIFRRFGIKNLWFPQRSAALCLIAAAKKEGVRVFELQHGMIKTLSSSYGGDLDADSLFIPDTYLTYCKMSDYRILGMQEKDVVEVGYAFVNYLKSVKRESISDGYDKRVLFISDLPNEERRKRFLPFFLDFAKQNHNVAFYYRPHPEEWLSDEQKREFGVVKNIFLNDNKEDLFSTMLNFDNVLGINSTGLYDALDLGRKVGRFSIDGLCKPLFWDEGDEKYFYLVSDNASFQDFINAPTDLKPSKEVYKPFNVTLFNELLNSNGCL